jgi:hypothetical protein
LDEHTYLIRFGIMSQVGRFAASPDSQAPFERGEFVVIQSHRGLELGEVLIADDRPARDGGSASGTSAAPSGGDNSRDWSLDRPLVLRTAGPKDLAQSACAEALRPSRFALCQRVLAEENWPWELIEVEPLLDDSATILHYLGPLDLDVASLRARFRVECDLEIVLEPAGTNLDAGGSHAQTNDESESSGCGSCDCGAGGGCGSDQAVIEEPAEPGPAAAMSPSPLAHKGCASCAISRLRVPRRRCPA